MPKCFSDRIGNDRVNESLRNSSATKKTCSVLLDTTFLKRRMNCTIGRQFICDSPVILKSDTGWARTRGNLEHKGWTLLEIPLHTLFSRISKSMELTEFVRLKSECNLWVTSWGKSWCFYSQQKVRYQQVISLAKYFEYFGGKWSSFWKLHDADKPNKGEENEE